jgi:Methyltransferase domain
MENMSAPAAATPEDIQVMVAKLKKLGYTVDELAKKMDIIPIELAPPSALLKLDFGCGSNPREGFEGVDCINFEGKVKHVVNLVEREPLLTNSMDPSKPHGGQFKRWPWPDDSVEEAHASHFLEHLDAEERIHFANELCRVLIKGGKCTVITPHWASCRAYGDPTHKWPPVSEFWFYYISREWRLGNPNKVCPCNKNKECKQCNGVGVINMAPNAPHTDIKFKPNGFNCNFAATWGYSFGPELAARNEEFRQFALTNYKEAALDIVATMVCEK